MSKRKFTNLKKSGTHREAREFLDYDYLDKLNDDEKAFLNKFSAEFYNDYYRNDGTDMCPPKTQQRKDQQNLRAARRRDIWNQRQRADVTDDARDVLQQRMNSRSGRKIEQSAKECAKTLVNKDDKDYE